VDDIQRWDAVDTMYEVSTGEWVTYADHVAAVAAAEQRAGEEAHGHYMDGYNTAWSLSAAEIERQVREEEQVAQSLAVAESFAAGVKAARDAVAALPWKVAVSFGPIDCDRSCEHGPCVCSGVMRPEAWLTGPADALAAIDALTGGDNSNGGNQP